MRACLVSLLLILALPASSRGADLPLFDAHIHYNQDAWPVVSPAEAVALLRQAGLKRALVSSTDDEGTQRLLAAAPDLVVPELRPYRRLDDPGTWVRDESIVAHVEGRLRAHRYAAIGEFHVHGADADLAVPRRLVQLAKQHGLMLHAHADAEAVERIFRQDPTARVIWAHAGMEVPDRVRGMLRRYRSLWADLARSDHVADGKVLPEWRSLFMEFPDRFLVGTDTYAPEVWRQVPERAAWMRAWLADLPPGIAERIAWKNGETLLGAIATTQP